MAETRTATGPDGKQWTIDSRSSRWPTLHTLPVNVHGETINPVAWLIRSLIALAIGLTIGLVLWVIALPFALLFGRKRIVEARTEGKTLRWRTSAGHEQAVLDEVAAALGRGEEKPVPAKARPI